MPLCNRVTPFGDIVSHPARYPPATAMFGNRGVLHDDNRRIVKPHAGRMWLSCRLHVSRTRKTQRDDNRAFNGRKRVLMTPRRYTELFFLDEPTALAAGHRPCACCRRQDYTLFLRAWTRAFPRREPWTAAAVDSALHAERLAPGGGKARHAARLADLPDGVLVTALSSSREDGGAWLLWRGALHEWSHLGYGEARGVAGLLEERGAAHEVEVLTPRSLVATLQAGFAPGRPHASAEG